MRLTRTAPIAAVLVFGALAAPAGAVPADLRSPDAANPPEFRTTYEPAPAGDVRSPDVVDAGQGRTPSTVPAPVVQITGSSRPDGFDWADAGIGAAGALGLIAISVGGTMTLRRRPMTVA
jgi:hypothetical protein